MKCLLACGLAAALLLTASDADAQGANPIMDSVKVQFDYINHYILETAAKVPENLYSFRPTPEVRTIAQQIGHIADSNLTFCGAARGQKADPLNAEKTLTTKAQLEKALADSIAFCDEVIAGMDDKAGTEVVKFFTSLFPRPTARAIVLAFNTAHNYEHYGNLTTYMRLNKIVPPSSEPKVHD